MSKHVPQWRLDMAMIVETLETSRDHLCTYLVSVEGAELRTLLQTKRAMELAIKLGKQYVK